VLETESIGGILSFQKKQPIKSLTIIIFVSLSSVFLSNKQTPNKPLVFFFVLSILRLFKKKKKKKKK